MIIHYFAPRDDYVHKTAFCLFSRRIYLRSLMFNAFVVFINLKPPQKLILIDPSPSFCAVHDYLINCIEINSLYTIQYDDASVSAQFSTIYIRPVWFLVRRERWKSGEKKIAGRDRKNKQMFVN